MAAIWNDIELEWENKTYRIRPTLEFVNVIEQRRGHSLMTLLQRITNQDLPSGVACAVVADALRYAGANVTADEVFEATAGVAVNLVQMASAIVVGCLPSQSPSSDEKGGAGKKPARRVTKKKSPRRPPR